MNKTVTINISGIIFHIEEDAYEKLNRYLTTIKGYFKDSDGRDEIMTDIESRIAEMLQEKIDKSKQVIVMNDVDHVIGVMGKPEDFVTGDDPVPPSASDHATAYQSTKRRRVFRDPDDRILGGVCSGIGAYFNIDPLWFRGAFLVSFFVFGSGLLLYLLLWIIIPQAKTAAEKLEMRGESVNINNIGKTVNEELEHLKKKAKDFGTEAGNLMPSGGRSRISNSSQKFFDFLTGLAQNAVRILAVILAVLSILVGTALIVALLGSLFGAASIIHVESGGSLISYSLRDFLLLFFNDNEQIDLAIVGLILFLVTPLVLLVYQGIRTLFKIKTKKRYVIIASSVVWLTGLIILTCVGVGIGKDFAQETNYRQKINIQQPQSDTLYLKSSNDDAYAEHQYDYDSRVTIGNWNLVVTDGKKISFGYAKLDVVPSETDSFELVMIRTARGETKKEATSRAKNINYQFTQHDSVLQFNTYYNIPDEDKWRNQKVKLLVKVPRNKVIYLDKTMEHIIYDIDNVSNTWDFDMLGRKWIMTESGLTCLDCEGLEVNGDALTAPPAPPAPPQPPKKHNRHQKHNEN